MAKQVGRKTKRLGYFAGEKLNSLTQNQMDHLLQLATADATERLLVVSAWAAKKIFKENASNPKIEDYLILLMDTLTKIGENKVSTNAIAGDLEALCKIKWDEKQNCFINLKYKGE